MHPFKNSNAFHVSFESIYLLPIYIEEVDAKGILNLKTCKQSSLWPHSQREVVPSQEARTYLAFTT